MGLLQGRNFGKALVRVAHWRRGAATPRKRRLKDATDRGSRTRGARRRESSTGVASNRMRWL